MPELKQLDLSDSDLGMDSESDLEGEDSNNSKEQN